MIYVLLGPNSRLYGQGGIFKGKMTNIWYKDLAKVVPTIETVVLIMLPRCQDDLCPLRLQLQTSWTWGILRGKMKIMRYKCFAKVVPTIEKNVLNILPICEDDLCPLKLQLQPLWAGGTWEGKWQLWDTSAQQKLFLSLRQLSGLKVQWIIRTAGNYLFKEHKNIFVLSKNG